MSDRKVDYSELVTAIQEEDEVQTNKLLNELLPRLQDYLEVVMGADSGVAEECVHQAFANVYEQIRQDRIDHPEYIFSYLMRSCRRQYYRYYEHMVTTHLTEEQKYDYLVEPAEQYEQLLEEDRKKILKDCLEQLDAKARQFISYFLDRPETTTWQASQHFNMSKGSVRTRKSRIMSRLNECYKRMTKNNF